MSNAHGSAAERLALLSEFHRRTHSLSIWALDAAKVIRPDPDWREVCRWFAAYGEHREWMLKHWHILELFGLPRVEAVVWEKMGWQNWHATVIESLVHTGYTMRLGVWVGTPEDKGSRYVVWPDQLDWSRDDLGLAADLPDLDRSRETAWRRVRLNSGQKADGALLTDLPSHIWQECCGWSLLGHFDLWTLVPHLRAELAATRRLLPSQVATLDPGNVSVSPNDGPGPKRTFLWRGKSADFSRAPTRYRLCQALWSGNDGAPKMEQSLAGVRQVVYPNEAEAEAKFKNLVQQVRTAFEAEGMAITITIASELIWLDPLPE